MKKKQDLQILSVTPLAGISGGELAIRCRGFVPGIDSKVLLGQMEAFILSASEDRIIIRLPESPQSLGLMLQVERKTSNVFPFSLVTQLAPGLHPVTNPVVASDGSIITTISGSRGQEIAQPLVRITGRGEIIPFPCQIMNPTGLAFSKEGQLHITSRHDGTVLRYRDFEQLEVIAEDLGVPCGIVFDSKGFLYVGDRTGRIFRIDASGNKEEFVSLEPSISAYHLAIDMEDCLYVTGPTFAIRDCLYRVSKEGRVTAMMDGLARPQGMAFLPEGELLIATGYQGKKGIFRYSPLTGNMTHYLAAPILVGLAVSGQNIYLASNDSIYSAPLPGTASVN
jgi:sugar lactone lactonase YvrE